MATKAELLKCYKDISVENAKLKSIYNTEKKANQKLKEDLKNASSSFRDITVIRTESVKLSNKVKILQGEMEAKTESIDYLNDRMSEIRTSLETVAAVKFPSIMLGFDVMYNGAPQEPEDELLSLLRHLYRLTK